MNLEWLEKNTIFETIVGSQAYGTNNENSDEDIGGVCIPPIEYFVGSGSRFEQVNNFFDENGEKIDKTIYSLNKAIKLLRDNNPNMMDYLFVPDRCIKKITPEWESILEIRDDFISTKCKYTYQGYAYSQLERIKTHRAYIFKPVDKPNRSDFGLSDTPIFPPAQVEQIAKISVDYIDADKRDLFLQDASSILESDLNTVLRKYVNDDLLQIVLPEFKKSQTAFITALSSLSSKYLKDEYIDVASKELAYISAYKNWQRYNTWKNNRNPKRMELEQKCQYDSKHASHLIRLQKMSVEILSGKGVNVDRTNIDKDELMSIRNGNWDFIAVLDYSDALNKEADALYKVCTLPKSPDHNKIENKLIEVMTGFLKIG